ncbi:metallophosphoesterase family protein [Rhizomicrobium electricum]|uniref:Metallophosphoesterase family protein n=1 Tax=Rhizomicrobium electricum TaxID=480070 RepID=A0ABP3PB00_9PROT|nr:metallophosphoesterase family protein [Rhizomicrobium electricum]NIJ48248.1 putative phosphoesterase [Rhizomicrobium electricum]
MKLAVLSDIHGNLGALDAVLADCSARGVDTIVNLGDILSGPLEPAATAARLMPLGLPTIRGNHERQLLEDDRAVMGPSDRHALGELDDHVLQWIAALPVWLQIGDILLCHGRPGDDMRYLLETVGPEGARPATTAEIAERLDGIDARLILCGHSHMPRVVRLADGRLAVNPGSVGLPAYGWDWPHDHKMETGSPHARYAVIERTKDGFAAEIVRIAYDWDAAAARAEANGRPEWAKALRTGRV